jgi:two-component sensor histidine kinase
MDATRTWTTDGGPPDLLGAPSEARSQVRAVCRHLDADLVADASLVASELVTNAVQHGVPPVELTVTWGVDDVHVAVRDHSLAEPWIRTRRPGQGGFGVQVVDALAATWGVMPERGGKLVWARLQGG